jgi:DNA-binding NarL/FixJ family response regulator
MTLMRELAEGEAHEVRVFLVDDHTVVRTGLSAYLSTEPWMRVVGEAGDGQAALDRLAVLDRAGDLPDVVLMDLQMPRMDGVTATGAIKQRWPDIEVVAVTSFTDEARVHAALDAGACGYVIKDADPEELAAAIRAAYAGEMHLDPAVARLLAQRIRTKKPADDLVEPLTDRERDVLGLLGQGMSNKEIGTQLFITERTARTYVSNILGKLGLASRTQAALWAVEHKIAERPPA